jgi:hypothetical protein
MPSCHHKIAIKSLRRQPQVESPSKMSPQGISRCYPLIMGKLICALFLTFAFQAHALKSACYPNTPEAKSWPICVIYLHGLHPANDQGSYAKYEKQNRPILIKFSNEYLTSHHCRLAAPASPQVKFNSLVGAQTLDWQHESLSAVQNAAQAACGGAELMKGRTLIGFSAGAFAAYHLAIPTKKGGCGAFSDYKEMIAIGVPEIANKVHGHRIDGTCPVLKAYVTHDFAGQFGETMQQSIAASLPEGPTQMAEGVPAQAPAAR